MAKIKNKRRKDGRFAVHVYLGTVDGVARHKTVYGKTQKEADQKAVELKAKRRRGIDMLAGNKLFSEWAQWWLELKAPTVGIRQAQNYKYGVNRLCEWFGDLQPEKILQADVQQKINELAKRNPSTGKPSSKRTLQESLLLLNQVFEFIINNRGAEYNPTRGVNILKTAPRSKRRALTPEEQQWVIDTPHRAQRAAMVMMFAGLRRGELVVLEREDCHLEEGRISVNKAAEIVNGKFTVKNYTKTEAGMRNVFIPKILVDFLREDFAREDAAQNKKVSHIHHQLVIPGKNGQLMSEQAWRVMWDSYMTDLNFKYGNHLDKTGKPAKSKHNKNGVEITIPPFTSYWLRHTFASLLYLSGVDLLTAKEQMGHKDIKTTLAIYTHLDQIYKIRSMKKLDDYLKISIDGLHSKVQIGGQLGGQHNA